MHKRSKSAVTRALQRISSRNDVSGSLATPNEQPLEEEASSAVDFDPNSNGLIQPPDGRTSLQSQRPHLATTMSNTTAPRAADTSPVTPASATQGASLEQSVRLFKVFEALRSGNTAAIAKASGEHGQLEGTTIIHLAIQCADQSTVEYVLSQVGADIDAKDKEGNTPLHVAAMLGRASVVKLLLSRQEGAADESIANFQGKTALDLARNPEIFQQLTLARSMFIDRQTKIIHGLVGKGQYDALEKLLGDSHVRSAVDVNGPELATDSATIDSGGTLLHEAARKKDLKLAQLLLLNGADPFRRDRKGKLPQDVTKDDRTRAILKKSPAAQAAQRNIQEKTILGADPASQAGASNGAAETGVGGKESREMKGFLHKWTNYTSGYKLRWFVLEDGVLSYYKHQDDAGSACRGAINMKIARLSMDAKDKLKFEIHGKSSVKYNLKANHQVEAKRWFWALNNAVQFAKDEAKVEQKRQQQESLALREARNEQADRQRAREADIAHSGGGLKPATAVGLTPSYMSTPLGGSTLGDGDASDAEMFIGSTRALSHTTTHIDGDMDEDDDYGDDASVNEVQPANKDAFSITAQSAKLQLDLLEQVSAALQSQARSKPDTSISEPVVVQALTSYDSAVGNLKTLLGDLLRISKDHEAYWQYRLDREQNIRRLWEDSMAQVAREQEVLEEKIGESEDKRRKTKRALREALEGGAVATPLALEETKELAPPTVRADGRRQTMAELTNNEVSDDESEDEEVFFDAVEAGQVEVVEVMPVTSPRLAPKEPAVITTDGPVAGDGEDARAQEIAKSFRGYEDPPRQRLKLDADNRPKVGLWGILKSMIGKDMTRMTLPVSFNEPTSLLYRVVEDMEYTDLLNVAADRNDSTERLVYVAGFAASEYASTIGRVAKPFNPLLGETYEYCRPDLGYRFFIEQVTHHPPVGAAYAESPKWDYYGESAVKSKFYGKSFEFNPLGTWFLRLRIPDGGEELYTWKKVTSSVVGIITGNPTVDNYGPMEVKNWTTGEICYLDFKPKGWKASSAFQVSGKVVDTAGRTRWSIGGRWNDKIYARLTPGYEADVSAGGTGKAGSKDQAFLVWEAHPRPAGIPFNITPFVVTLNALPDRLRPFLAPTDSRLRPDQRAMEEGEYDFAATEKNRVEEGQRARRRQREAKGEEFEPRWFTKARHPVTGEDFWSFNGRYWKVRDEVVEGKRTWEEEKLEEIF